MLSPFTNRRIRCIEYNAFEMKTYGFTTHADRVKRFKKFYYEYLAWGGSFSWKVFRDDGRIF